MPLDQVLKNVAASRENGIGGIKIKVGQPDLRVDLERVTAVRELLGPDFPLMVDANHQWDRLKAQRACRKFEPLDLTWIEEPLDAYDFDGHAALAASLDTAIATGEMLTSFGEHAQLIERNGADFVQPDAPRVGGITPFLQIMSYASLRGLKLAPHFAMEIHLHLAAAYPEEPWREHFEWLEPMFNERLELRGGRIHVPNRPGLGFSLSEQALKWTVGSEAFVPGESFVWTRLRRYRFGRRQSREGCLIRHLIRQARAGPFPLYSSMHSAMKRRARSYKRRASSQIYLICPIGRDLPRPYHPKIGTGCWEVGVGSVFSRSKSDV
jgi:hypothetical protein